MGVWCEPPCGHGQNLLLAGMVVPEFDLTCSECGRRFHCIGGWTYRNEDAGTLVAFRGSYRELEAAA